MLFAGQHTSSITSAWTGYEMINARAAAYVPALEEQKRVVAKHGSEITFDALGVRGLVCLWLTGSSSSSSMLYLWRAMRGWGLSPLNEKMCSVR